MEQWQVESNIEAFGYYETAKILKKRKLSFELAYFCIFHRLPRI